MTNEDLQATYVLHARPYRETSLLLDCLTEHHGRIALVARGVRRKKSSLRGILQPFVPLTASWFGRGELQTLKTADVSEHVKPLAGKKIFSGLYINELLIRVLAKGDVCASIFYLYQQVINSPLNEENLRYFEKRLLEELGYGLQITRIVDTEIEVSPDQYYLFYPEQGVVLGPDQANLSAQKFIFLGKNLQAIANDNFSSAEILKDAKRLMRFAFQPLLNDKPLKTRELFS